MTNPETIRLQSNSAIHTARVILQSIEDFDIKDVEGVKLGILRARGLLADSHTLLEKLKC